MLRGIIARLKPVAAKVKMQVQSLPFAGQYRTASFRAAISLMTFTLLMALAIQLWGPVATQHPELARKDSLTEPPRESSTRSPHPESYPEADPESSETTLTRKMTASPPRHKERVPRPNSHPDYVAVSLTPIMVVRGDSQLVSYPRIVIPEHSKAVRISLTLRPGCSPGSYTVRLLRQDGATLATVKLNSRDGRRVVMSIHSKILSEGTYGLVVVDKNGLSDRYGFTVVRRDTCNCKEPDKTRPAGVQAPPKSPLEPV